MPNLLRIKSHLALRGILSVALPLVAATAHIAPAQTIQPTETRASLVREAASELSLPLVSTWRRPNVGAIGFAPIGSSGLVHLALAGGEILALQGATGAIVWRDQFGGEISAQPASDATGVYVATRSDKPGSAANVKGSIRLVGATTGLTRWARELPRPVIGTLTITETHVLAIDDGNNLLAFDKVTGAPLWFVQMASQITTTLAAGNGSIYLGSKDGAICVDERTGRIVWQRELNRKQNPTAINLDAARVYIGASDGHVYALDAKTGGVSWKKRLSGTIEHLASTENGVLAFSRASAVYNFEARRGGRMWKRQLPGRLTSPPIIDSGVVAVTPLAAGSCFVIDTRTGRSLNVIGVGGDAIIRSSFVDGRLLLMLDDELICYAASRGGESSTSNSSPP